MKRMNLRDLDVSALGLGCMGMSEYYNTSDWDRGTATIHHALECGITLLDTADVYGAGHNEVLVGRAIATAGLPREEIQLATKFGIDRSGGDHDRRIRGSAAYVQRSCEASLLRLGLEVIDLYYLHRPPQDVPIEETVAAMAALVEQGKVRHLGLSEVSAELLRRAHSVHPITAVQSEFSLWERAVEDVTPTMAELGVGLVPYSPLGRGFLTATIDPTQLTAGDFRANNPRFQGDAGQANLRIAQAVREVAKRLDATAAQVALAWVYAQAERLGVSLVAIPGTTRPERIDENLASLELALDEAALTQLDALADQVVGERYPAAYRSALAAAEAGTQR
ncbi:MAG TPA: aldo/keto reductase [Solirubrobacteraceae bacterium]|nr:aldo/keto reductase [Solirubrobacteraceae bacterium]